MEQLKYVIEDSTIARLLGMESFTSDEAAILESGGDRKSVV